MRRQLGRVRRALLRLVAGPTAVVTRWAGLTSIRRHHVFGPALNASSEVWDLGANVGDFSALIIERFRCRSLAVEPSPKNFDAIHDVPGLEKMRAAIGSRAGEATLYISPNSEACSLIPSLPAGEGVESQTTVLVETFATLRAHRGRLPDLVKLDIEGFELEVLRTLTDEELLAVPQWTVEFHDFIESGMAADVQEAKARFARLGFKDVVAEAPVNVDCLFLQPHRCGLTPPQILALGVLRNVLLPLGSFLIRQSG